MGFQEKFEAFKESKWVVPTYIILVILATIAVAYLSGCLAMILIPVVMFAIPYYLGEKRIKYLVLVGVIVIAADSLAFGALDANFISSYKAPEQKSEDKATLTNGFIDPSVGGEDTLFNFTVTFTAENVTNVSDSGVVVYLNTSDIQEFKPAEQEYYPMVEIDTNDLVAADGKDYYFTRTFPRGIHFFHFAVRIANPPGGGGATWNDTLVYDSLSGKDLRTTGPINADILYIFQTTVLNALVYLVFTSILFMIFVMMYWWLGRSRIERAKWEERMKEAGELEPAETKIPEFECTNCGRPVHEDALRCPHCGAVFDEDEEEE